MSCASELESTIGTKLLVAGVFLATVLVLPGTVAGFELPRAALIAVLGVAVLGLGIGTARDVWLRVSVATRSTLVLLPLLALWSLVVSIVAGAGWLGLWGTETRFVGLFVLLGGIAVAIATPLLTGSRESLDSVVWSLVAGLGIVVVYALIQAVGADPAAWSGRFGSRPVSTVGNPNFTAAVVALAAPLTMWVAARSGRRWLLAALGIPILLVLVLAQALLGFVAAAAGLLGWFAAVTVTPERWRHVQGWLVAAIPLGSVLGGVAIVTIGHLGGYETAITRVGYWRAVWSIVERSPLLGVGPGRVGAYSREFRSPESVVEGSSEAITDSAHLWLLDLAGAAGLPAALLYIAILVLVGLVLRRTWLEAGVPGRRRVAVLVGLLAAHGAQSAISVSIPLTVWLGFLLIGLVLSLDTPERAAGPSGSRRRGRKQQIAARDLAGGIVAVALALIVAVPVAQGLLAARALFVAEAALAAGAPADAFVAASSAAERAPWWPDTWLAVARAAQPLQDVDAARNAVDRAYQADERNLEAVMSQGTLAWSLGEEDEAERWFTRARELDRWGFEIRLVIAEWAIDTGRYELAEDSLDVIDRVVSETMDAAERSAELRDELAAARR